MIGGLGLIWRVFTDRVKKGECITIFSCLLLSRNNAEEALQKLNGTVIGKQTVRLSWGRNPANKQVVLLLVPKRKVPYSYYLLMFGCIWKELLGI